jgi:hypothetical protein
MSEQKETLQREIIDSRTLNGLMMHLNNSNSEDNSNNDNSSNNTLNAHIEIINTYLNALDFILEYEKKNIPDYIHNEKIENDKILENENSFYRCIYNIIPFTDFFNNKVK